MSIAFTRSLLGVVLVLAPLGCAASSSSKSKTPVTDSLSGESPAPRSANPENAEAPLSSTDPCAERLHALCGPLLFYYSIHRQLPENLDALRDLAGPDPAVEFTCPVSGKPYVYEPAGLPLTGTGAGLVIYDAEPTHSGKRWAVKAQEPRGAAGTLTTDVIPAPESFFRQAAAPAPEN